jgi:hypothetical protein
MPKGLRGFQKGNQFVRNNTAWLKSSLVRKGRPSKLKGRFFTEQHKQRIARALKGRKKSAQHVENNRKAQTGKKLTLETRMKIANSERGEKSHFWKGGVTDINDIIRNSVEYRLWHEAVFKRDNWTCRFCNQRGGELHADHIKPFAYFPELRFAIDNGRTLCKECHRKTPTYGWKSRKLDFK